MLPVTNALASLQLLVKGLVASRLGAFLHSYAKGATTKTTMIPMITVTYINYIMRHYDGTMNVSSNAAKHDIRYQMMMMMMMIFRYVQSVST